MFLIDLGRQTPPEPSEQEELSQSAVMSKSHKLAVSEEGILSDLPIKYQSMEVGWL